MKTVKKPNKKNFSLPELRDAYPKEQSIGNLSGKLYKKQISLAI